MLIMRYLLLKSKSYIQISVLTKNTYRNQRHDDEVMELALCIRPYFYGMDKTLINDYCNDNDVSWDGAVKRRLFIAEHNYNRIFRINML